MRGNPFVTAAYIFEGSGPLTMKAYEKIETARAIHARRSPNINAFAQRLYSSSSSSSDKNLLQGVSVTQYIFVVKHNLQCDNVCNLHLIISTKSLIKA